MRTYSLLAGDLIALNIIEIVIQLRMKHVTSINHIQCGGVTSTLCPILAAEPHLQSASAPELTPVTKYGALALRHPGQQRSTVM